MDYKKRISVDAPINLVKFYNVDINYIYDVIEVRDKLPVM